MLQLKVITEPGWNSSGRNGWQRHVPFEGAAEDWDARPSLQGTASTGMSWAQEQSSRELLIVEEP